MHGTETRLGNNHANPCESMRTLPEHSYGNTIAEQKEAPTGSQGGGQAINTGNIAWLETVPQGNHTS